MKTSISTIIVSILSLALFQNPIIEAATPAFDPVLFDASRLPSPIVTENSVEVCLNSRYSQHSLSGTANAQQLSNVLWAAGKTPVTGSYRDIYVATRTGTYLYHPNGHSLSRHSDDATDDGAFAIIYESGLDFDTGGIAPGTYDVTVLGGSTLTNARKNVVVSAPETSVDLGTLLEGDVNNNVIINLDDYAILSNCWLESDSQAGYDIRTDFDRSGFVDAADLCLLATNWLRISPVEITP